ncbi:hypothetical protein [Burkholderia anthina]|uniref:Uncharacterized protein n=1 Tax=Burkholderia anthina TaxID=179879 RepID=A0A6P2G3W3_9BURK|nr:hypothetical protein [Burkholderia anthina]MBM2767071.1 hypothetical protein [Burkholderia anthina]VVU47704.1 hypothetical protein BAN20980_00396 [Burkholderia anthina]
MGLFSWLKGRPNETPDQQPKPSEAPLPAASPDRTTLPPKERLRALGPIGCPDISPLPTPAVEQLRAAEAQALASGAIAAKWRSSRYYEPYGGTDHPERDHKIYTLRDNWAMQKGLMQAGPDGYTDEITAPHEETGCQCYFVYVHALRDLPEEMLTEHGLAERRKSDAIWAEMKRKHGEPKITLGAVRRAKDKS